MRKLTLKRKNKTVEYDFPTEFSEVTLDAALSFIEVEKKLHLCVAADKFDKVLYLQLIIEGIAAFMDLEPEDFFDIPVGDFDSHLRGFTPKSILETTINLINIFDSVVALFEALKPVLYIDREFVFQHGDYMYKVPNFIKQNIGKGINNPKLSVREAIECLEIKRRMQGVKDEKNATFTEIITQTAILARRIHGKNLEEFPTDQAEIDEFINERTKLFSTMTAEVGFNVGFFLLSIIEI